MKLLFNIFRVTSTIVNHINELADDRADGGVSSHLTANDANSLNLLNSGNNRFIDDDDADDDDDVEEDDVDDENDYDENEVDDFPQQTRFDALRVVQVRDGNFVRLGFGAVVVKIPELRV